MAKGAQSQVFIVLSFRREKSETQDARLSANPLSLENVDRDESQQTAANRSGNFVFWNMGRAKEYLTGSLRMDSSLYATSIIAAGGA